MPIRIEFFGIPKARAGVGLVEVDARTLGDALGAAARAFPAFAAACLTDGGTLHPHYIANVNGRAFVRDLATPLNPGDAVLILSADPGG